MKKMLLVVFLVLALSACSININVPSSSAPAEPSETDGSSSEYQSSTFSGFTREGFIEKLEKELNRGSDSYKTLTVEHAIEESDTWVYWYNIPSASPELFPDTLLVISTTESGVDVCDIRASADYGKMMQADGSTKAVENLEFIDAVYSIALALDPDTDITAFEDKLQLYTVTEESSFYSGDAFTAFRWADVDQTSVSFTPPL